MHLLQKNAYFWKRKSVTVANWHLKCLCCIRSVLLYGTKICAMNEKISTDLKCFSSGATVICLIFIWHYTHLTTDSSSDARIPRNNKHTFIKYMELKIYEINYNPKDLIQFIVWGTKYKLLYFYNSWEWREAIFELEDFVASVNHKKFLMAD